MDLAAAKRDVFQATHEKLSRVIAKKTLQGKKRTQETRLRARASRRILHFSMLLLEFEAARQIVDPPTAAQVRQVRDLVATVRDMAVREAATRAGLKKITSAMDEANAG